MQLLRALLKDLFALTAHKAHANYHVGHVKHIQKVHLEQDAQDGDGNLDEATDEPQ